jgi:hypothetical protein
MIEFDLTAALKAIPAVGGRVKPVTAPQDYPAPYITYQVILGNEDQCTNGTVFGRTSRIQVDVWAKTYEEAKSIKTDAVAAIVALGGGEISAQDLYESDTGLHRQLIEFKYKE